MRRLAETRYAQQPAPATLRASLPLHAAGIWAVNPFIRKLRHGPLLTVEDEAILTGLLGPERLRERGDIVAEGAEPRSIPIILRGWACRYKQLENGRRQITSLILPGDLCEPFGALPRTQDHALAALTPVMLSLVPATALREAAGSNARIEAALWWDLLFSAAIHREHLTSLGRRSANERLAHFFCELQLRLGLVGLSDQASYELPLIQTDLADLFGLSAVHVNRSLQDLRASGLISLRDRRLTLHDVEGLRELSMFDPAYLLLGNAVKP